MRSSAPDGYLYPASIFAPVELPEIGPAGAGNGKRLNFVVGQYQRLPTPFPFPRFGGVGGARSPATTGNRAWRDTTAAWHHELKRGAANNILVSIFLTKVVASPFQLVQLGSYPAKQVE